MRYRTELDTATEREESCKLSSLKLKALLRRDVTGRESGHNQRAVTIHLIPKSIFPRGAGEHMIPVKR
jgi:hypothetical protein